MTVPVYAVVPSYGRESVHQCLEALLPQVDGLVLVQTKPFRVAPHRNLVRLPADSSRELNISEWWNLGIRIASAVSYPQPAWDVLIVNDDVVAPPGLASALSTGMRAGTADLAYLPGQAPGRITPITGWCFMLRGESGIKADPQFRWWFGDNDIELQARAKGGAVAVPGCQVTHLSPGGHDHLMGECIPVDEKRFREKWSL